MLLMDTEGLLMDTEGYTQLANTFLIEELPFVSLSYAASSELNLR